MTIPERLNMAHIIDWLGNIHYTSWSGAYLEEGTAYYLVNIATGIEVFPSSLLKSLYELPDDDDKTADILDDVFPNGWSIEIASYEDNYEDEVGIK